MKQGRSTKRKSTKRKTGDAKTPQLNVKTPQFYLSPRETFLVTTQQELRNHSLRRESAGRDIGYQNVSLDERRLLNLERQQAQEAAKFLNQQVSYVTFILGQMQEYSQQIQAIL